MGKHKPIYDPSTDCGDYVVAVGCHDLRTTGKKRFQKQYYSHTTRPGSLKSMTMDKMFEKWGGGEVLRRAVRGMLPKNRLRDKRLERLKSELYNFSNTCDYFGRANHAVQLSRASAILTGLISSESITSLFLGNCPKSRRHLRPPRVSNR